MMRKNFSLKLLIAVAILSVFVGCSSNDKIKIDPKNPVMIVIWHYYHGAQKTAFDNVIKEFNDTIGHEKGIIAEAVSHGGVDELAANVIGAAKGELDAGEMPNIFGSYGDTALDVLNMGMAAEIDSYLTEKELSEYEESFIHEGKIGTDKLYVFPIAKSTESLILNKTDFDAFVEGTQSSGLNETVDYDDLSTWEGILKVADIYYRYTDLKSPDLDNDGKAFLGIDALANYIIIGSKQLGQDLVKVEEGNTVINLDKNIMFRIWNTYYEAMVRGKFAKYGKFCSDDIKTGDILCYIGSTTSANYFPAELMLDSGEAKNIEMMVLPMPVFENGKKYAISQGAGMVIVKSSKEKEYASALFLKWFTESERNVLFSLGSGYLPVKKESLDENILNSAFEVIERDDISTQNAIKALKVGIGQLKNYTLYSSDVFVGGADFRNKLPKLLLNAAVEDRASFINLTHEGLSPEQAYSELSKQSSVKFDIWLDSLKK